MNFDAQPESNDYGPFSEGWTAAMIEHAQDGESKSSGKPMTTIEWKLARPDGKGGWLFKKAWSYFVWSNASQMTMLKKAVSACGLEPTGNLSPEQLIGKKLEAYVKIETDDTGKYKPKNIVTGFRIPSGQPAVVAPPPPPVNDDDSDIPF